MNEKEPRAITIGLTPILHYDGPVTLRLADDDDKYWVLEHRNSDYVRNNCLNRDRITLANHGKWWENNRAALREYFIIEVDKQRVGGLFLAYNKSAKNSAEVSLWLLEKESGKGYATEALDTIYRYAQFRKLYSLEACVMDYNFASLGLFMKNGYRITDRDSITDINTKETQYLYWFERVIK